MYIYEQKSILNGLQKFGTKMNLSLIKNKKFNEQETC